MKRARKKVAWLCIFSTLLMGCYSSVMIDPTGNEKQEISAANIEYVGTKDGRKYKFDKPPAIFNDAIVIGPTGDEKDQIPSDEIGYVILKNGKQHKFDEPPAIVNGAIVFEPTGHEKEKMYLGEIGYVIMRDGTAHIFDRPPVIVNGSILGELKATAARGFANDPTAWVSVAKGTRVSIPLSDVAEVSVKELNVGLTTATVVGVCVVALIGLGGTWEFHPLGK